MASLREGRGCTRGALAAVASALLSLSPALLAPACVPLPPILSGPGIPGGKVEGIRPGATTRGELLAALGPPSAVFPRGAGEPVAPPVVYGPSGFGGAPAVAPLFGSVPGDGEAAWIPFVERGTAGGDDRVYYYRRTSSWKLGVFLVLAVWVRGWTSSERLWVLVDERKGVVKDLYAYP